MDKKIKIEKCVEFYNELSKRLTSTHEVVGSCNQDISSYLIPIGSIDELTYERKPQNSFRFSDHWNWYSNVNKCPDEHYIQCYSPDIPYARPRLSPGKASKPRFGISIAYFDGCRYRVIFGEKFDRKTKTWYFVTPTIEEVCESLGISA